VNSIAVDRKVRSVIRLRQGHGRRARDGHPWVYSNEVVMDAAAKAIAPGTVVALVDQAGVSLGAAFFNPHSLIAARRLGIGADADPEAALIAPRIAAAAVLRERLFDQPYYRLVHAEADGLPALAIDRFAGIAVCQLNGAGVDRAADAIVAALQSALGLTGIVLRRDSPARAWDGLALAAPEIIGTVPDTLVITENGVRYVVEPRGGQKTGWFFDQRENRAFMARLAAKAASVLDVYTHTGGFALAAARAGAKRVVGIDSSEPALVLAKEAAVLNNVADRVSFDRAEAFATLESMAPTGVRFDVVIADPPPFVRARKDLKAGAKGYEKLARLAAALVARPGFLFIASCSHALPVDEFVRHVVRGVVRAGRSGRILSSLGAGPDHPVHPLLPETAYLKSLVLALD
jgi:23S rRNA (cytosine1962-C5)-methyltransferase